MLIRSTIFGFGWHELNTELSVFGFRATMWLQFNWIIDLFNFWYIVAFYLRNFIVILKLIFVRYLTDYGHLLSKMDLRTQGLLLAVSKLDFFWLISFHFVITNIASSNRIALFFQPQLLKKRVQASGNQNHPLLIITNRRNSWETIISHNWSQFITTIWYSNWNIV